MGEPGRISAFWLQCGVTVAVAAFYVISQNYAANHATYP